MGSPLIFVQTTLTCGPYVSETRRNRIQLQYLIGRPFVTTISSYNPNLNRTCETIGNVGFTFTAFVHSVPMQIKLKALSGV